VYKVENLANVQIEEQLNFLGEAGWELVTVFYRPDLPYPYLCVMKRPG